MNLIVRAWLVHTRPQGAGYKGCIGAKWGTEIDVATLLSNIVAVQTIVSFIPIYLVVRNE